MFCSFTQFSGLKPLLQYCPTVMKESCLFSTVNMQMKEKALVRGKRLKEGCFFTLLFSQEAESTSWSQAAPLRLLLFSLLFSYACNCMLELEHTGLPRDDQLVPGKDM